MSQGIMYYIAETEAERQAYFAIREAAYDEDLSFPRGAGAESVADADSLIILARDGGMILGGARLQLAENREDLHLVKLLPDYRERLPTGIMFGDDCAEYGALALIPSHRNTAITLGLYLYSERVCRARLIRHVFFATERVRSRLYHRAYRAAYGKVSPPHGIRGSVRLRVRQRGLASYRDVDSQRHHFSLWGGGSRRES